jgi:hypothetical protein
MTCSKDPGPILYPSQLNQVQILTSYLFKMHLTVIFSLRPSSSESVSKYCTHFPLTYIAILNARKSSDCTIVLPSDFTASHSRFDDNIDILMECQMC